MSIRSDITINWEISPREVTVDAPSIEFTMQDVLDTLRYNEALSKNMDNQSMVQGNGKVVLDDLGNATGLTVQLINTTVGFEARSGPTWIECYLSGGNLSGLESDGETVTTQVTHNNPYVNINKTSSVSATISKGVLDEQLAYGGILHYDENSIYTGQTHPTGTDAEPVNNMVDGIALATKYALREIHTYSDVNVNRDLEGFTVHGTVPELTFYTHGFKAHLFKFDTLKLNGDFNDSLIKAENCNIIEALNVYGAIDNSYHSGKILISANKNLNMDNSQSGIPGFDSPEIDMHVGQDTKLSLRAFSGGQTITNCDTINCVATLSFQDGGKPHLEPSCTDGILSVRGQGALDDRSNGSLIDITAWIESGDIDKLLSLAEADEEKNVQTNKYYKRNKDTKVVILEKDYSKDVNSNETLIKP